MAFKAFRKVILKDVDQKRQAEAVKEFLDQFNLSLIYGAFLNNGDYVNLSTSAIDFSHKLGEKYKGFFLTELDSGESVFNTRGSQDDKFITLTATGSCKAKIWVF